jgi:DHA1 family tetracycline resistance protein-like MFS transporter
MDKRRLATIFAIVFVDVLGFGLILPLLPYYATRFGASTLLIGLLTASYSAAQIIGSPILGRLSDRFGRRPILMVSIAGTAVSFLILGSASALWMLFAGRILDGLTGGNFTVAQSYITDVTSAKDRARGLGLTGAAFGLGFIIGPALGGLLSQWGYGVPAYVAAAVATVNVLLVVFFLPESLSAERKAELAAAPRGGVTLKRLVEALRRPLFGDALELRFFFGFAFATFQTMFSLWALKQLNLQPQAIGLLLAYVGILSVIVQLVLIGPLTKRFSEGLLLVVTLAVAGVFFFAWGASPNVPLLLVVLTPLCFAISIQNTVSQSVLSKTVSPTEVGGAFGLSSAVQNVGSIAAPIIGGAIIGSLGTWAPGALAGIICLGLLPFAWNKFAKPGAAFSVAPQVAEADAEAGVSAE